MSLCTHLSLQSVNELNQWLSALRKACSHNTNTMSCYHPGIYKADRWSCCHQKEKTGTADVFTMALYPDKCKSLYPCVLFCFYLKKGKCIQIHFFLQLSTQIFFNY